MTTWVVVADRFRARLFEAEADRAAMTEIEDLVHPEAREPNRVLADDRQGREAGPWGHQTFQARTTPHEKETGEFVHELGDRLGRAADEGSYDRLVLCAEPRLLGRLRSGLPEKVSRRVVGEVGKDLAAVVRPEDIRPYVEGML